MQTKNATYFTHFSQILRHVKKKGYIKYICENHESLFNMYIFHYKLGSAIWVLYQNEFDSLSPVQPEIKMPQIKVGLQ